MIIQTVLLLSISSSLFIKFQSCIASGDSEDDFVPDFFGGRRNEDLNSGMAPPRIRSKTRSGPKFNVRTLNFTQKLDHFGKCNRRFWNQRYMVNDAYFQPRPNGPIFIRIGGEGAIFEDDLQEGPLIRLAKEYKALVLSLEHRFYGESRPTPDLKSKNLRYLSSRQALADLEAFIISTKKQYETSNPNAKVVLYGCSYAGSLAAFHRRLYPNSTVGAISGFAPLIAIAKFTEYLTGVWQEIWEESNVCGHQTDDAIEQILCLALDRTKINDGFACEELEEYTSNERHAMMYEAIDFCEPKQLNKTNPNAIYSVYYNLYSRLMYVAQYRTKDSDGISDIKTYCRYMNDKSKGQHAFQRYGAWRKEVDGRCIIHNGKSVQALATDWNSNYAKSGTRQWLYQMCSEFGYFTGGDADFSYYMQTCQKSFGIDSMEENVKRTNELYGGRWGINPSNIHFLTSTADPWAAANNLFLDFELPPADEGKPWEPMSMDMTIDDISHCREPYGDCSDEKELVDAWKDIDVLVSRWIGKPKKDSSIFAECPRYVTNIQSRVTPGPGETWTVGHF